MGVCRLESWILPIILYGNQFFFSKDITSMESFSVVRRRKTLQMRATILKFTLYSHFVLPSYDNILEHFNTSDFAQTLMKRDTLSMISQT